MTREQQRLRDRTKLRDQLKDATEQVQAAYAEQEPYAADFWAADRALVALHSDRKLGLIVTKERMLAAYDKRMYAGKDWYPSKTLFRELTAWRKAILRELAEINRDMERAAKRADKPPRPPPSANQSSLL